MDFFEKSCVEQSSIEEQEKNITMDDAITLRAKRLDAPSSSRPLIDWLPFPHDCCRKHARREP